MATAFDGLGMQFMGKERQHMSGGPFSELAKMIPAGLAAYGLVKSGAVKNLNEGLNPKKMITDFFDKQGVAPPQMSGATNDMLAKANRDNSLTPDMVNLQNNVGSATETTSMSPAIPPGMSNPVELSPAPVPQNLPPVDVDQHIEDAFPLKSFVSPDTFKRDVSQDMAALQTTQAPAPSPSNVGQGQMGKDSQGDGGGILQALAPELLKMFLAG